MPLLPRRVKFFSLAKAQHEEQVLILLTGGRESSDYVSD